MVVGRVCVWGGVVWGEVVAFLVRCINVGVVPRATVEGLSFLLR